MDSITHIALGAVVGEALAGKKIGKEAMLFGAVAQSLPDIDFVASFWMSFSENLLAHRGFTHSFLFVVLTSAGLALVFDRWYQKPDMRFTPWLVFWMLQMTIHLLIDACNAYGVGWFEPFSHARVSAHCLFVADPFFSVWTGFAAAALLIMKRNHPARMKWVKVALLMSMLYVAYAFYNRHTIRKDVETALKENPIAYNRFLATPTPLNNWLWFVTVDIDTGFYVAHRSVFDRDQSIDFHYFPKNTEALRAYTDHESLQHLLRFSQGYYTVEAQGDTLIFNDLRFGQITGWATPENRFVFHYYLSHPSENMLVIQRGRFANWNTRTLARLVRRIRGLPAKSGN
jgi:inner membrane protein